MLFSYHFVVPTRNVLYWNSNENTFEGIKFGSPDTLPVCKEICLGVALKRPLKFPMYFVSKGSEFITVLISLLVFSESFQESIVVNYLNLWCKQGNCAFFVVLLVFWTLPLRFR